MSIANSRLERYTPLPRTAWVRTYAPLGRTAGLRTVSPGPARQRPAQGHVRAPAETVPPAVRRAVHLRDRWCIRCGSPDGLHVHHRRIKGQGGDTRPHTDCACNTILLCHVCHHWAHVQDRPMAEEEGLIISSSVTEPWLEEVLVRTADGGFTAWPDCTGTWVFEDPRDAA